MIQQNQIVAIQKDVIKQKEKALTQAYHYCQQADSFNGFVRRYEPFRVSDDETQNEQLPDETKIVQHAVKPMIDFIAKPLAEHVDIMASKDYGNCVALADVIVDGEKIIEKAPVTFLLAIEKELVGINTFIQSIPTLDPSKEWDLNGDLDLYQAEDQKQIRTINDTVPLVLHAATKEHPAQVAQKQVQVPTGTWQRTLYSGAIPLTRKLEMLENLSKVIKAVKLAREEANSVKVDRMIGVGEALLGKIFR